MNIKVFAPRLLSAMSQKDMTCAKLSRATGVGKDRISRYCHGMNPSVADAMKIASKLEVSLDWLCGMNAQEAEVVAKVGSLYGTTIKDRAKKIVDYYNGLKPGDYFTVAILAEKTGLAKWQVYAAAQYVPGVKELLKATYINRGLYLKPASSD